jgi:hypothetical protein
MPDTPVSPHVAAILDTWVGLRGSGLLTDAERVSLGTEVTRSGQPAPSPLFRGLNVTGPLGFRCGQVVTLGPVSASAAEDAALPYAENGDGTPVLMIFDSATGLCVADRAEAVSGYAEEEWVIAGRFRVTDIDIEDGGMAVTTLVQV